MLQSTMPTTMPKSLMGGRKRRSRRQYRGGKSRKNKQGGKRKQKSQRRNR